MNNRFKKRLKGFWVFLFYVSLNQISIANNTRGVKELIGYENGTKNKNSKNQK